MKITCTYAYPGSGHGPKRRSTSRPWPPSNSPPTRRRLQHPSAPKKASSKENLWEPGPSSHTTLEESIIDVGEPSHTEQTDLSSSQAEEEDVEYVQGFLTGDTADNTTGFDPELLDMVLWPPISSWSQSPPSPTVIVDQLMPVSSGPSWASSMPKSSARRYIADCHCLHTLAQLLEDTSTQWSDKGIDTLLMYISCGIKAYEEALSCPSCNICGDNGMLIAVVAQRLSAAATSVASKLCPAGSTNGSNNNSNNSNNNRLAGGTGGVFDGPIAFGDYRIEIPKIRASLVYNMTYQHLTDLQMLLGRFKNRVGLKRGSVDIIAGAEAMVVKSRSKIQQLLEASET
ncbi:hypothetical protein FHL15_010766 [Xylaria flabelliformis]|uniref:Uncharacterized protein n=1 Tax=Xylaria flabelliformis TaxID=2512241 RepID=A0A553HK52_9PEZI|nr:hypothetical protein FHL15_010766 [Xylaria flabelliformis]